MSSASQFPYEYRIVEFHDENNNVKSWLCQTIQNGAPVGNHFEAKTREQVFAWLRLMVGEYPETFFNGDGEGSPQSAAA